MKTNCFYASSLRRYGCGAALAGALLLPGLAAMGQTRLQWPTNSYDNTWDCILSGAGQQGIAFLKFSPDFTFTGYELDRSLLRNNTDDNDQTGRGGEDVGRNDESDGSSSSGRTNIFGFGPVQGPWTFDSRGRVIGFFTQVLNQSGGSTIYGPSLAATNVEFIVTDTVGSYLLTTNIDFGLFSEAVLNTNFTWSVVSPNDTLTYSFTRGFAFVNTNLTWVPGGGTATNAVSFVATVVPNKRLTLVSSTSFGKVTYSGVPMGKNPVPDLSGKWYGYKTVNQQSTLALFDLTSFQVDNPWPSDFPDVGSFPNIYFTTGGQGPGYTFDGVAMVSSRKKIGFAFQDDLLSATYGSLSASRRGTNAMTKGIQEPELPMRFKATWQQPPAPAPAF